jgi:hypothetical protein
MNITWIVFVILFTAAGLFYSRYRMRSIKESGREFLSKHPDAARVFLTSRALITSEAVQVHSVDGGTPELFMEKMKTGFYAVPGKSTVEISYTHTRPGVLHKTVTTTTDVVKKELVTEPKKSYMLGFDRDENAFTFEEYDPERK